MLSFYEWTAIYSSTQVQLPEKISKDIIKFGNLILDKDLAEKDGREDDIHITVLFGLHTNNPDDVEKIVKGFGEIEVTLGKTTVFYADKKRNSDVVKIDVDSDDLKRLNKLLRSELNYTNNYSDYHPHLTIAYVKPGKGNKYRFNDFKGIKVKFNSIVFSSKNKKKTKISLT